MLQKAAVRLCVAYNIHSIQRRRQTLPVWRQGQHGAQLSLEPVHDW